MTKKTGPPSKGRERTTRQSQPVPAPFLTTEQVLQQTGLPRETLFSWVRKGYMEKPRVDKMPHGRGRRALWWPHVVERIKSLRTMTGRGVPIQLAIHQIELEGSHNSALRYDEIRRFAEEWRVPGSAGDDFPQRLGLQEKASLLECFVFVVVRLAKLAGLDADAQARVEWSAAEFLAPAMMSLLVGNDPVLVVTPSGSEVWPRAALGAAFAQADNPDEWVALVSDGFTPPLPHEQYTRRWFPAFTCLDLGPVMRALWQRWDKKLALVPSLMRYEYAPVVWHRAGDEYIENDAVLTGWGHWPPAVMLDVEPLTARSIPRTHPQIKLEDAHARMQALMMRDREEGR